MKKIVFVILVLLAHRAWSQNVKISVDLDKPEYLPECPIWGLISLENVTDKEVGIAYAGVWPPQFLTENGIARLQIGWSDILNNLTYSSSNPSGSMVFKSTWKMPTGQSLLMPNEDPLLILKPKQKISWGGLFPYVFTKPGNYEIEIQLHKLVEIPSKTPLTSSIKANVSVVSENKESEWDFQIGYLSSSESSERLPSIKWLVKSKNGKKQKEGFFIEKGNCRIVIKDSSGKRVADWVYLRESGFEEKPSTDEEAVWTYPLSKEVFSTGKGKEIEEGNYTIEAYYRCYTGKKLFSDYEDLKISENFLRASDFKEEKFSKLLGNLNETESHSSVGAGKGIWISTKKVFEVKLSKQDLKKIFE